MKSSRLATAVMGAALIAMPLVAGAQKPMDLGKREFQSNCAVCHGEGGKGDGSYAGLLEKRVPDLTTLAKSNGGVYPIARVYEFIDGTQIVKAHGTREMPIWGDKYKVVAGEHYADYYGPYDQPAFVRARILALAEYVSRLQVK
jgi:mono/diheme cytochrome c family protein